MLAVVWFGAAIAQDIQIRGTVTSSGTDLPLPGVYVRIEGTNQGTATDANGRYQLSVPSNATLVFSSIGMTTYQVRVNGQQVIDVVLEESATEVEEVIVSAVAGSTIRRNLAYQLRKSGGMNWN
jgi:hypothetical protein